MLHRLAEEAARIGMPLYLVGGVVRDLLLGQPGSEFDIVVEGDALRLARSLASKFGGKLIQHEKFGTAKIDIGKWHWNHEITFGEQPLSSLDLVSARSETYRHPGALPTVGPGNITDDLRRRDFTINAMAVRLDGDSYGTLRDDFEGRHDLELGLVRILHPGSFLDDPTRMYRAVRYEKRYGFRLASETQALIPTARPLIDKISAQRIRHELDRMLEEPNSSEMLARLAELDLLQPIHPALSFDENVQQRMIKDRLLEKTIDPKLTQPFLRWLLWLMPLSHKQLESLNKRLHFHKSLFQSLLEASTLWSKLPGFHAMKPSQWVEHLEGFAPAAVYAAHLASPDGGSRDALGAYLFEWRHVKPRTSGSDLKRLGVPTGPRYQAILSRLRAAWLDGEVRNKQAESVLLSRLIASSKDRS